MSLYNALFGVNPASDMLMQVLNLTHSDVGRFRDCFLNSNIIAGEYVITVHTRNGGGNRPDYEDVTKKLRAHPNYLYDFDDEFDSTFASYVFKCPEDFLGEAKKVIRDIGDAILPAEKWKKLFEKLDDKNNDDPEIQNAMNVGKKIFGEIEKGVNIVEI